MRPKKLSKGAREALRLAFDPAGGPVQDILLREMARYAGAAASEAAASVAAAPASALVMGLAEAQQAAAEAMGPARPPVPTALELLAPISAATRQTESDRETLRVAAELGELVSSFGGASKKDSDSSAATAWIELPVVGEVPTPRVPDAPVDLDLLRELADMAPELEPGVRAAALRFGAVLLDQAAGRVAEAEEREKLERA